MTMTKPKNTVPKAQAPKPAATPKPVATPTQPEAVNGTLPEDSSKAEIKPSDAPTIPDAEKAEKGPETSNVEPSAQPEEPSEFVKYLLGLLAATEDQDQAEALSELIELVKANPDQEDDFITMAKEAFLEQYQAFVTAASQASPEDEADVEEDDARADRLKANAEAELAELKADSLKRQQEAEALQEEQPSRRNP